MKNGPEMLSDAELLAIMLRTGTKTKTPIELGREILKLAGENRGLLGLHHFSVKDLTKISGIGEVKAVQLLCIAEIAKRISKASTKINLQFDKPETIASYYMEKMRHLGTEELVVVLLDTKLRKQKEIIISKGTINMTLISSRQIFINALKEEAAYIVILHNHPSGDSTPSKQDVAVTQKIKEVSELVEIPLIDHIIIGDNRYTSFKQEGLL